MGIMGFQDALYKLRLPYASREAIAFADSSMEMVSYYAIKASTDLAEERGTYSSFKSSLWSQGILPVDSIDVLEEKPGRLTWIWTKRWSMDWSGFAQAREKNGYA